LVVACGVLVAGCTGSKNAASPAMTMTVPCATSTPIVVTTENLTRYRSDLCGAFNRSLKQLRNANALGAGDFEVRVRLAKLVESPKITCNLAISVSSKAEVLASASGGAKGRSDARDCIEVVLEDLVTRQVGPFMQQHVAKLAGPASAGSAADPSAPAPVPLQPAP